jgi:hypothetical protein
LKLNGKTYIEGSAIDTLCFEGLLTYRKKQLEEATAEPTKAHKLAALEPLENAIVFDILSSKKIIREPRSLYDAWVQSIMIPLVEIAKDDIRLFERIHNEEWKLKLLPIKFDIPDSHWPYVLDWSYSNLARLYDVGYAAGERFYQENKPALRSAARERATQAAASARSSSPEQPAAAAGGK